MRLFRSWEVAGKPGNALASILNHHWSLSIPGSRTKMQKCMPAQSVHVPLVIQKQLFIDRKSNGVYSLNCDGDRGGGEISREFVKKQKCSVSSFIAQSC